MIRQIAVFVENQKGSLLKVTTALHENGIQILALSTVDSPEFGILRLIVDDPVKAGSVLPKLGIAAKECEVIAVKMESQDQMDALLQVMQEGNININYIYSSFGSDGNRPLLILHAADMDLTEEMLRGRGFHCL